MRTQNAGLQMQMATPDEARSSKLPQAVLALQLTTLTMQTNFKLKYLRELSREKVESSLVEKLMRVLPKFDAQQQV